jgi:hypothetical protein
VLFFAACAAPPDADPPESRTLAAAVKALRAGDIDELRNQQGKGVGLAAHAAMLADRFDPEAWVIALGASEREHDLAKAATAVAARDDSALAEALGFGDQPLLADVLGGGGSIYSRRAGGRGFFETGPQPVDVLNGFSAPGLPSGCAAVELSLWGIENQRRFRVNIGLDTAGVTNLQASPELARESIDPPAGAKRHADPQQSLTGRMRELPLQSLVDPRWYGANVTLLHNDGTIERAELGRDDAGWAVIDSSVETQEQRLGRIRDERLDFLRRRANEYERTSGRWPRGLREISFKPWQLVDPTAPEGRNGWADHDKKPKPGIELAAQPDQYAAISTHQTQKGRRAITKEGELFWLP